MGASFGSGSCPSGHAPSDHEASPSDPSRGAELERLSAAATAGTWHLDMFPYRDVETGVEEPPRCEGICTHDDDDGLADEVATCGERDARFIVALVNAYRSGQLTPAFAAAMLSGGPDINPEIELSEPRPVTIDYVNWRGEQGRRRIMPTGRMVYGATEWHPRHQWLLEAMDLDKAAVRLFAFEDMQMLGPSVSDEQSKTEDRDSGLSPKDASAAPIGETPEPPSSTEGEEMRLEKRAKRANARADDADRRARVLLSRAMGAEEQRDNARRRCCFLQDEITSLRSELKAVRDERDEALRLDAPERTLDPQWGMDAFRAVLGDSYTPRKWGKHRALHHSSLKFVMGYEGLPDEVYDVVASLIWDCGITGNRAKFAFDEVATIRKQLIAADDRALASEAEASHLRERVEKTLDEACRMSAILLMAGEMTAQERRTAHAVANGLAAKVRAALSSSQTETRDA